MADGYWYTQILPRVFTLVSYRLKRALTGKTSAAIKCTTNGQSEGSPYFPTWYMHELAPIEMGQDLENKTVNAVLETIEVIAYTKSKDECNLLMSETVMQMKALGFNVTAMPIVTSDTNVFSGVCRFRRMVGGGDTDLIDNS